MPPKKGRGKRAASPAADNTTAQQQPPPKKGKGKAKAAPIADDDSEPPAKKAKTEEDPKLHEAQIAKKGLSRIPVDEECTLSGYRVHVDEGSGLIYDASLNQTHASGNNNKFYRIQVLNNGGNYQTWTRWGRVGERGQSAVLGNGSLNDALAQFAKKFKDKSGHSWDDRGAKPKPNKYVFVERSYDPDSEEDDGDAQAEAGASRARSRSPAKSSLAAPVMSLMELIFNQQYFEASMAALNYDAAKMPLGKLSKKTIRDGYSLLKELNDLLDDPSLAANYGQSAAQATEDLSNRYYSTVPHTFGRNRPPVISTHDMLKKEVELLESLTDLKDADAIMKIKSADDVHPLDARYKGLRMEEMTPLERNSDEFQGISEYLTKTRGATHAYSYEVMDIFRISREDEKDHFKTGRFANIKSDRRLLWHGSRATNFGSILGQGLRIAPPEAPVSGYMFDKGIYLADMSSKSAGYCYPYISGGHALLLLCEAELGDPMQVLRNAQYDAATTAKEQGVFSTFGQGMSGPKAWKDAGCLHPSLKGVQMPDVSTPPGSTGVQGAALLYNEFIAYDVAQVKLRYLLRVRMD